VAVVERGATIEGLGVGTRRPWERYCFVLLLAAAVVAALADVFGQSPTSSTASAGGATLEVQAPERLRGGLYFQLRVTIRARRAVERPTLVLDRGWFEEMSVNSIVPQPADQRSAADGRVVLEYGRLAAGSTLVSYVYFQVNPTNVGQRHADVELLDGSRLLATVHRTIVVFP